MKNHSFFAGAVFLAGSACVTSAWADVYKCVDADGHVTYTNARSAAKNCKVLSQDQRVSTVPGRATPSPAGFPRVDADTQRSRDSERRGILDQELANEIRNLDQARKDLAEQEANPRPDERNVGGSINQAKLQERVRPWRDRVALHERNVEALRKEIANLK